MKTSVAIKLLSGSLAVLGVALLTMLSSQTVHAADTSNFEADFIISDTVFTDYNSMSASDIQAFLNAKNSVCLKNFQTLSLVDQNNDGLGDEPYGKGSNEMVSAATLIWQASQLYRISPKVILATLEKEQGLITRTDCPSWRYNTALGYGCPDSEPCDTSAYGFTRQIDYGVWHFRGFFDDTYPIPTKVPGNNYIAYNPDGSCGGTTLNIKNRATAALYSYTPYQPNAATLAAAPGQVVNCGAYGNLNFWRYFSNWFGDPKQFFIPFEDPRWMEIKSDTYKVHYLTMENTGPLLTAGRQAYFVDKILIGDEWYARTTWDQSNNNLDLIPVSDLREVPITAIAPKWVSIKTNTTKIDPLRNKSYETIPKWVATQVVDRITVNGASYYRTAFEKDTGTTRVIPTNATEDFTLYNFVEPRVMVAKNDIQKVNIQTGAPVDTITKGTALFMSKRITVSGVTYAQPASDSGTIYGIQASDLTELTRDSELLTPLDDPRWLRLKSNTYKVNLPSKTNYEAELSSGAQAYFVDKILIDGEWYARTAWDADRDNLNFIAANTLEDIPIAPITPKWISISSNTAKKDPLRNIEYEDVQKWTGVRVVDAITVGGLLYYRTAYESSANSLRLIPADVTENFTFYSFVTPRNMTTTEPVQKVNVQTGAAVSSLPQGTTLFMNARITINGVLYAQAQSDNGTLYAIPASSLSD